MLTFCSRVKMSKKWQK